jgi:hypothetical protein
MPICVVSPLSASGSTPRCWHNSSYILNHLLTILILFIFGVHPTPNPLLNILPLSSPFGPFLIRPYFPYPAPSSLHNVFFEHVFRVLCHRSASPNHPQARFGSADTCHALFTEAWRRPGGDALSHRVQRMFHFRHASPRIFSARKRTRPRPITNPDKASSSPGLHLRGAANSLRDLAVCVALSRPQIVQGISPNYGWIVDG